MKKGKEIKIHYWLDGGYPYSVWRLEGLMYNKNIREALERFKPQFSDRVHTKGTEKEYTSRVLNYWENLGIIDKRPTGKGWRKYAFLDFVWMDIIQELRRFGFSNEKIKYAYDKLSEGNTIPLAKQYFFNFYATLVMAKLPVYVLVFSNGNIDFGTFHEIKYTAEFSKLENHIQIYLNPIVLKHIKGGISKLPEADAFSDLSKEENEVIDQIRSGKYAGVNVKMKEGKINYIESEEQLLSNENIVDVLKQEKYQDIAIKNIDGKVSSIKRTIKKKIEEKNKKK